MILRIQIHKFLAQKAEKSKMDSFLTLGITVKMQAGIISIPAPCFIIVQKEKNLDPLEEKPVYIFSPD